NKQCVAFMGTHVVSGQGKMVIVAVGKATAFGKLSKEIVRNKPETNFDKGINAFGLLLLKFTLFLTLVVFATNAFFRHDVLTAFLFALALAIGLTPELLPIILTINLAKGALRMEHYGVIVKFLPSIQNLGAMDVLCSDKTGTLTSGDIALDSYENEKGQKDEDVLHFGLLNSHFQAGFKNPLDISLLYHKENFDINQYEKVDEIPFDFTRKRLSVIVEIKKTKKRLLITKGAPHAIFGLLKNKNIQHIEEKYKTLAENGYRVIAVAEKTIVEKSRYVKSDESGLSFKGFLIFSDKVKEGVSQIIADLKNHGVQIKILTGDNELVAEKVCKEVGIATDTILTGDAIDKLTEEKIREKVESCNIFTQLSPEQKSKIIMLLQKNGHTVGFLGDGINDAPPLKTSDVGISVQNGSDIAKDVADIILLKKSFHAIKEGVTEGRKTYANILKYIMMQTSSNVGNMITVAVASFFLPFIPMLPTQILLNDLLYDTSQIAIPTDTVDVSFLKKPRKWDLSFIQRFTVIFGPISSLFDFLTFFGLFVFFHASPVLFRSGWFVESLVSQLLIVFSIRTKQVPFFKSLPSKVLFLSTIAAVAIGVLLPVSPLASVFSFTALPLQFYLFLPCLIIFYFLLVERTKMWFFRKYFY
ncbi:MAG: magnesium-translocating P-type ATPase, partial [Candidatus Levyibacteriota bacterium]